MGRLPTLDLFSGIGGFAMGLKSLCRTVAYCEKDIGCQEILRANIAKGSLEGSPIFGDIELLTGADIPGQPVLITAGFPCQDISQSNPGGVGIHGKRSGLVKHVFRLMDELPSVNAVMLENSPNITAKGLPWLLLQLKNRGFHVNHGVVDGVGQGAPCKRSRWFLLATRKTSMFDSLQSVPRFSFQCKVVPPRVVVLPTLLQRSANLARCRRLGNAAIPACVSYAFLWLSGLPTPKLREDVDLKLCITDGVSRYPAKHWRPPTHEPWGRYKCLSDRSTRVFSNQVFYEVKTLSHMKKHGPHHPWRVNANFVEYVMGFPQNWTNTAI